MGTNRAATKVEYYRRQAMQLPAIAQAQPEGMDRDRLVKLAMQYDRLADG